MDAVESGVGRSGRVGKQAQTMLQMFATTIRPREPVRFTGGGWQASCRRLCLAHRQFDCKGATMSNSFVVAFVVVRVLILFL